MRVDAAPRSAQIERVPEKGSARGFFEIERWSSEEDAITLRGGKGQHEYVRGQDAFLLHARRRDVDLIALSDADAPTRTCYPTQVIEAAAKLGNEVCGM
jgi:hypothetical protein